MEESAVFQVVVVNETAHYVGVGHLNYQLVSVPYTVGEDITCKKLKEHIKILLRYSSNRERHLTIRTAEGIRKRNGRRYFGCTPCYYEFCDVDGNECKCDDVKLKLFTLRDEDKITLVPYPHLRYFASVRGEKLCS